MGYPGRHNIYAATIRRMVTEALESQEQEFREQHGSDSDEQLLAYLKSCAVRLHRSPWPGEIVGGICIEQRFGTWDRALALTQLPPPPTLNQQSSFDRYRREVERQKEVYRQRKAEKKLQAQKRLVQQAARKKQDT